MPTKTTGRRRAPSGALAAARARTSLNVAKGEIETAIDTMRYTDTLTGESPASVALPAVREAIARLKRAEADLVIADREGDS